MFFSLPCYEFEFNGERNFCLSRKTLVNNDVIIGYNYNNSYHQELIYEANNINIITILLHDGVFEWSNSYARFHGLKQYHPVVHDLFFVFGTTAEFKFLRAMSATKCVKYVPAYLKVKAKVMENRMVDAQYDFMITTANKSYFSDVEMWTLIDLLQSIIDSAEKSGFSYFTRIFDKNLYSNLRIPKNIKNIIDIPFPDALSLVSSGVVTTRSSLMYEAMGLNPQIAVCEIIYRDSPIFSTPGWVIYQGLNASDVLKSMFDGDSERINYQKILYSDVQSVDMTHATNIKNQTRFTKTMLPRLKAFIKSVIR